MHTFNSQHRANLSRPVLISLLLCLLSPVIQAATAQTDNNHASWTENRSLEAADTGLIYSLPVVNQKQLASEIDTLNQQLKQRQENLSQVIEKNHFTATDALIIAALPGGILYAAVKKQRVLQAEEELDKVTSQLASLAEFRTTNQNPLQPAMIASR
ncbi:hypothetical protein [Sedimenticola sp.]|uniref:hypothetical protein n=1 Tax=Sedimenticola sp. TaxID=1940285 RepID=UPI002583E7B3|nr:hypothetical protein [Sedimenticola sp.]MCW8903333.1 hypothetical protein [Sedimenticola sp.]